MKRIKDFFTKLFASKPAAPVVLEPESILDTVKAMAKNVYPSLKTDVTSSLFDRKFAIIMDNEINSTTSHYAYAGVVPSVEELTEVLSVQMKLAHAMASASESLSYIAGVQAITGPVGQIFLLSQEDSSLKVVSDAIQANAIAATKITATIETVTANTLEKIFNAPSVANLAPIRDAAGELGMNVVRDVVKEIVTAAPTAKTVKAAFEDIRKAARRGWGNTILVNSKSLELLKSHYKVINSGRSQQGTAYISEVGTIEIDDKYLTVFLADGVEALDKTALVAYVGRTNGQIDSGFFVSPYATSGTNVVHSTIYARVGTKFQRNGEQYYRTVPLTLKKARVKKVKEESPVVKSP